MSHQVIITFDLDGNKVQENAEKEAGRQIAKQVMSEICEGSWQGSINAKYLAREFLRQEVVAVLKDCKDEIINEAIKDVFASVTKSKAVRDKLEKVVRHDTDELG